MAQQHDLDLANQIGAAFRADLNLALKAISAKQWGASPPATLVSYMDWVDTTSATAPSFKLYDGASWLIMGVIDVTNHLWQPVIGGGTDSIASAGTTDLSTKAASGISITGTTTITSFGNVPKGQIKRLTFAASLTLTYNATSMILPGGRSIQTRAGDTAIAESLGAGNWQVISYQSAAALPNSGLLTEATVASAATANIGAATSQIINITGTTGITSFGSGANTDSPLYFVRFAGALTLTHNGTSLILPGGANIVTTAGDSLIALYLGSGNWKVLTYNYITPASTQVVPQSHIAGFLPSISNVGATTAAITVAAGQAADSTAAAYITKATTTAWAISNGNAINGYQGGTTLPNSSTIHFFICSGSSGVGTFASTSLTPTIPAGYNTYYRRIFSCKTTGAGALIPYTPIEINGGGMLAQLTTQVLNLNGNVTTTASLVTLSSIPQGVKMKARLRAISNTNSYNGFLITSPDETDVAPTVGGAGGYNGTAPGWDGASTSVAQGIINPLKDVVTDTSAQVRMRSTATINVQMVCSAFEDFRR